jgi:hypothetical protein
VDFLTRADLTGRIRGLVIMLDDKITIEQSRAADELIDADEFGPALEQLAGVLAETGASLADDLRRDFERLSTQVGNQDRVLELLGACPPAG